MTLELNQRFLIVNRTQGCDWCFAFITGAVSLMATDWITAATTTGTTMQYTGVASNFD